MRCPVPSSHATVSNLLKQPQPHQRITVKIAACFRNLKQAAEPLQNGPCQAKSEASLSE
jgi:hypothetical protein